jgi:4-amino-4-deoxy-L-arabinose transferase-like glycosyltransferase
VHARYFKEDIFVAPFVVLALAALIGVLRSPTLGRTITLGAIIGLAAGSKYVGSLLLLPYALIVMISSGCNNERIRARLTRAGIAALTAGCVFVIIESAGLA